MNTMENNTTSDRPRVLRYAFILSLVTLPLGLFPVSAQDPPDPDPGPLKVAPRQSSQDGYTIWRLDVNSGCLFSDHEYTLNIPEDPNNLSDVTLTMTNWDVDYQSQDCNGRPEVDVMYFNDHRLGILTGANDSWSKNEWRLDRSQLVKGANRIYIDTDSTNTDCWCVGVGYVEVRARVGFKVISHTPADKEKNRDYRSHRLHLQVTFSGEYNPATLTDTTFKLEYRDPWGSYHQVEGDLQRLSSTQFQFVPNYNLRDAVRYYATVVGGPSGVKSIGGAQLPQDTVWHFWTVPALSILADDFNGECPPSTPPCPALELAVFQVARNKPMVETKPAVARLYIRWREHHDFHADDQLTKMKVDARIHELYTVMRRTVKRPNEYTVPNRRTARNTINFFHVPASPFNYTVSVRPVSQANVPPLQFETSLKLAGTGRQPRIRFDYYTLRDGAWAGGVPLPALATGRNLLPSSSRTIQHQFPALVVRHRNRGIHRIGYTLTGNTIDAENCGIANVVSCPDVSLFFDENMAEHLCVYAKMKSLRGGRKFVGVTTPTICPDGANFAIGGDVFFHQFGAGGGHADAIAHEVGHLYGISRANNPDRGHRNNSDGVEGFQVLGRVNRSRVENPARAVSLMHARVRPNGTKWIHNDDYDDLIGSVTKAAEKNLGAYLIVDGTINTTTGSVHLAPAFLQELPNDPVTDTGECLVELLDGTGGVISSSHVDPGLEISTTYADGRTAHFKMQKTTDDRWFSVSLPWDPGAGKLRIGCQGTVYHEETFSDHKPTVAFVNLAGGQLLSGVYSVEWSGSDADGDPLAYQLQLSTDGGTTWTPLSFVSMATSFALDTTTIGSADDAQLRIMATDGFNTSYDARPVEIRNPLTVSGNTPVDASFPDGVPLGTQVSAVFATAIDGAALEASQFELLEGGYLEVAGAVTLSADGRELVFQPAVPLRPLTEYTALVHRTLRDVEGNTLLSDHTWTFTTEADRDPPWVVTRSPARSELDVPLNAIVQVRFSEPVAAGTVNGGSFLLLDETSAAVSGTVSYNGSTMTALFVPSDPLAPEADYLATITTAVTDEAGNPLEVPCEWRFTSGTTPHIGLRTTGVFSDQANDADGDGLYDTLTIFVQVEVSAAGTYNLNGRLLDRNHRLIEWATSGDLYLTAGYHTLALTYPGTSIRSNDEDGPYLLTSLNFYDTADPARADTRFAAYQTYPYSVEDFFAMLIFGGIPDRELAENGLIEDVVNLRDYTRHASLPIAEVEYSVFINTDPNLEISIDAEANLDVFTHFGVETTSEVTIEATDSLGNRELATFLVRVLPRLCRDTLERTLSHWAAVPGPDDGGFTEPWRPDTTAGHSPTTSYFVSGEGRIKDQTLLLNLPIEVPSGGSPRLGFWHRFDTESEFDGGVLEYSTDGGVSWHDVLEGNGGTVAPNGQRFVAKGYVSTLSSGFGNPLSGRAAWTGQTAGWVATVVDLADFAGHTVLFRWRFGCDVSDFEKGWWVDDVALDLEDVVCGLENPVFHDGFESGDVSKWSRSVP